MPFILCTRPSWPSHCLPSILSGLSSRPQSARGPLLLLPWSLLLGPEEEWAKEVVISRGCPLPHHRPWASRNLAASWMLSQDVGYVEPLGPQVWDREELHRTVCSSNLGAKGALSQISDFPGSFFEISK